MNAVQGLRSMDGHAGLCGFFHTFNSKKMSIRFYTSDAKDNSIIAYGDTHQKDRHFKITYKKGRYFSFKKRCAKYCELAESQSLEDAKQACIVSEDFHSQRETPKSRHAWRQDENGHTCIKCGIRKKTIWMSAMKNGKSIIYFLADGSRTSYCPNCA